jgi:hypothetical protein
MHKSPSLIDLERLDLSKLRDQEQFRTRLIEDWSVAPVLADLIVCRLTESAIALENARNRITNLEDRLESQGNEQ